MLLRPILRPIHAGSRFDGDAFNDKITALKRKPIMAFDSPKGPTSHLISPHGSPGKAIGIFRQAKTRFDSDESFSRKVKSASGRIEWPEIGAYRSPRPRATLSRPPLLPRAIASRSAPPNPPEPPPLRLGRLRSPHPPHH